MADWRVEYDNDTGPNDEGFWQWWEVVRDTGEYRGPYRCSTEAEADWLAGVLNGIAGHTLDGQDAEEMER